jgi:hypothetical protein
MQIAQELSKNSPAHYLQVSQKPGRKALNMEKVIHAEIKPCPRRLRSWKRTCSRCGRDGGAPRSTPGLLPEAGRRVGGDLLCLRTFTRQKHAQ